VRIVAGDFADEQVLALVHAHLAGMYASSPPESVFALDLSGLQATDVSFFTAWEGETLVGMGALREIDALSGELKSMRTHADHLRKGVAAVMLEHLLGTARSRGYGRVSLETGSSAPFEAAQTLYRKFGFVEGDAFADYEANPFSRFFHLQL
jgi:putative acetyltransferase